MSLSDEQKSRYSRNIALTQIGAQGQESLLESSVLIVGAGGLGSPLLLYLAAAGVGKITIIDPDRVDLSNLQRQIIFNQNNVGRFKAEEASNTIKSLNSDVEISFFNTQLNETNAEDLISSHDIIADCSDNFATRFLINKYCHNLKKTLVSGAVIGFEGQVATFKSYEKDQPCYQCFCPQTPNEDELPNCSNGGIIGAAAGVIGSMQAVEIIKEITENSESLAGFISIYDAQKTTFRKVKINKRKNCKICEQER